MPESGVPGLRKYYYVSRKSIWSFPIRDEWGKSEFRRKEKREKSELKGNPLGDPKSFGLRDRSQKGGLPRLMYFILQKGIFCGSKRCPQEEEIIKGGLGEGGRKEKKGNHAEKSDKSHQKGGKDKREEWGGAVHFVQLVKKKSATS